MLHVRCLLLLVASLTNCQVHADDNDLLIIQQGNLPIIISAPHGGALDLPNAEPRKGEGKQKGAAGFRTARDTGTEELALLVATAIDERMKGTPWCVISRVHRKFVDFNRPPEIGVEHQEARKIHDLYHQTLKEAVSDIRGKFQHGLLIDIHGQSASAKTVFRGTSNGQTVQGLTKRTGLEALTGEKSLTGILKSHGWNVHPDPFDGKEQEGYTGGYIVRSYGSHRADGIDSVQLEFGSEYRSKQNRERIAKELAEAVQEYARLYLKQP